ncbi:hypothetical protein D3C74_334820 [compost metagenome]
MLEGERRAVESDVVGQVARVRRVRDGRLEVEDLEHPLEADECGHDVHLHVGQRGERAVEACEVRGQGHDHADGERPPDGHDATEPVDDRDGDRGDGRQGHAEDRRVHGRGHADVAHASGLLGVGRGLLLGAAEDLHEVGARDVEALVHHLRGVGVEGVALAGDARKPAADPARGQDEHGQERERDEGELPRHGEHRREHEHHGQQVREDVGQRRGEGLLGSEDVPVEPLDQGSGAGAAEERERHALDVVEHRSPQVEDEAFAHARRVPALADAQDS